MAAIYNFFEMTLGWNMLFSWVGTLTVIGAILTIIAGIILKIFSK